MTGVSRDRLDPKGLFLGLKKKNLLLSPMWRKSECPQYSGPSKMSPFASTSHWQLLGALILIFIGRWCRVIVPIDQPLLTGILFHSNLFFAKS